MKTIRFVVLPLVMPGVFTAGIYIFITSWNEYLFAMMLSGQAVRTVTVALQLFIGEFTIQWGLLTAGGTLIALPVTNSLSSRSETARGRNSRPVR